MAEHVPAENNDFDEGMDHFESQRYEEALSCFGREIADNPGHLPAWIMKSLALKLLERYDDALCSCDGAIRAVCADANILSLKGDILCTLKRYEEAIAC